MAVKIEQMVGDEACPTLICGLTADPDGFPAGPFCFTGVLLGFFAEDSRPWERNATTIDKKEGKRRLSSAQFSPKCSKYVKKQMNYRSHMITVNNKKKVDSRGHQPANYKQQKSL